MSDLSRFQKFMMERIHRADIRNAPYNPRILSREAKKRLQDVLEQEGLVAPLVYNRRTGLLVSGHQRLRIIDELEGTKDYSLDVAVIDVDEKTEKRLNIFLNNVSSQGTWDEEKLIELFLEDIDLIKMSGFNKSEEDFFLKLLKEAESAEEDQATDYMLQTKRELEEISEGVEVDKEVLEKKKEDKKTQWMKVVDELFEEPEPKAPEEDVPNYEFREKRENKKRQDTTTTCYLKIVFSSMESRASFLSRFGLKDSEFIYETDLGF